MTTEPAHIVPRETARLEAQEWWCERLHRPCGRWIAKRLEATSVTPGQVMFLGGCCGVLSGILIVAASTNPILAVFGGLALMAACILDCTDGDLARARNEQSLIGMIRDGINDNMVGTSVFVGMTVNMVAQSGNPWMWLLGIAAGLSTSAHTMSFDAKRKQYMQILKLAPPQDMYPVEKVYALRDEARRAGRRLDAILLWSYAYFRRTQNVGISSTEARDAYAFWRANRCQMLAWSPMGSSTHFTLIYVAAFLSPLWPESFIAAAVVQAGVFNILYAALLTRGWRAA